MMPLEFATHSARYWGYYSEPSRCFLVAEIDANHTHTHTHTAEIDATHTHTHVFRCELLRWLWEPVTGWKDLVLARGVFDEEAMLEWRAEE